MNRFLIVIVITGILFTGCSTGNRDVAFSGIPENGIQIRFFYNSLGDAMVYLTDGKNKQELFLIGFANSGELIKKFSWSPDNSKVAWLITNSSNEKYTYGKRLIVFDITPFPDKVKKVFDDKKRDLQDFKLSNKMLACKYSDSKLYIIHEFSNSSGTEKTE